MLIEVYADIACPWCYIGEQRLQKALSQLPDLNAELLWRPFQLRPDQPREGIAWPEFARHKFGSPERANAIFANVTSVAAKDGVHLDFNKMVSAPNTLDAHRLVLFARQRGLEWQMAEALYAAYFAEGFDLNDRNVLVTTASELGFSPEQVQAYLDSDANVAEVYASQITAEQLGIEGVPYYIIDERYAISGAQPVEAFVEALTTVSAVQVS